MLANHHDENIHHHHTQSHEIAKAGINCHLDNMVCEGSFLNDFLPVTVVLPLCYRITQAFYHGSFYAQHHFYGEMRGPPFLG